MMACVNAVLAFCLVVVANGFVLPAPVSSFSRGLAPRTTAVSQSISQVKLAPSARTAAVRTTVSGLSMAAKAQAPANNYWEGEWVCADCGYIYDIDDCGGLYFEQQKRGWVCPQCRGPRRRFAKKVGNQVGITQDGGDAPILLFSFLGLAATVAFGFWFAKQ